MAVKKKEEKKQSIKTVSEEAQMNLLDKDFYIGYYTYVQRTKGNHV